MSAFLVSQVGRSRCSLPLMSSSMQLVIDSNQLQSPALRDFLRRSANNRAVLPDFAAMEAYKGDTLSSVFKSMAIVSEFPTQVVVLKGSAKICGLSGRRRGLQRRLIDDSQTRGFPEYARALRLAGAGNASLQRQILAHGESASGHFDKMLHDAQEMREVFDVLGRTYTKEERSILRGRCPYTPAMTDKLVRSLIEIAGMIFRDSPLIRRTPTYEELPNTFIFRVALAVYVMAITRVAHGGSRHMKPEKLRNDLVDMMFVAYGTFFDGILSDDKGMTRLFTEVCVLLSGALNAEVPAMNQLLGR